MRRKVDPAVQRAADHFSEVYRSLRRDGVDADAAAKIAERAARRLLPSARQATGVADDALQADGGGE
jgi:hypothetical protein